LGRISQFEILADINKWDDDAKRLYLASSLPGADKSILSDLTQDERRNYSRLKLALSRKFGSAYKAEMYRAKLQSRFRQKSETIYELASSIMKLTRQAYPKADLQLLDTLAVDYFIDVLEDSDIRLRIRQSQPESINQAETLAIRLEIFKNADRFKHRSVCIVSEEKESVSNDGKADLIMPILATFMSKISSREINKNQNGNKFEKGKGNGTQQNMNPHSQGTNNGQTEGKTSQTAKNAETSLSDKVKQGGNLKESRPRVGTRHWNH